MRSIALTLERFRSKFKQGPVRKCWPWQGALSNGYGTFWNGERQVQAHRFYWTLLYGPIPEGYVIDHLCHNSDLKCDARYCRHRACVNPSHLEAVEHGENIRRAMARKRLVNS